MDKLVYLKHSNLEMNVIYNNQYKHFVYKEKIINFVNFVLHFVQNVHPILHQIVKNVFLLHFNMELVVLWNVQMKYL